VCRSAGLRAARWASGAPSSATPSPFVPTAPRVAAGGSVARTGPVRRARSRVRDTGGVANATTAAPAPLRTERETARRTWPRRAALGVVLVVLAVVAVLTGDLGARLLLGGLGLLAAARGAGLLRAGSVPAGAAAVAGGLAAVAVAVGSAAATGWVLLVGVPLSLLAAAAVALARGGAARRAGAALLVWTVLVGALLAGTLASQGADRAAAVATVVAALATGLAAVPLLVAAAGLRSVANTPEPPRAAGCAGCACSGGGCGILRA
jgi:hypothetical protein